MVDEAYYIQVHILPVCLDRSMNTAVHRLHFLCPRGPVCCNQTRDAPAGRQYRCRVCGGCQVAGAATAAQQRERHSAKSCSRCFLHTCNVCDGTHCVEPGCKISPCTICISFSPAEGCLGQVEADGLQCGGVQSSGRGRQHPAAALPLPHQRPQLWQHRGYLCDRLPVLHCCRSYHCSVGSST
jgi:hypothetical protein